MNPLRRIINRSPELQNAVTRMKTMSDYRKKVGLASRSPEMLVKYTFQSIVKRDLNLDEPKTFHEKINWLKLYWYDERAILCSDKYLMRQYVEEKGLGFLLDELYCVLDSADQIRPENLPDAPFVLKATHDSGHIVFCRDKEQMDWGLIRRQFAWRLKIDYCYMSGEWPYHTDQARIVCEEFLEDHKNGELLDYKLFCFNGIPRLCFLASDRKHHAKADFYDMEWNKLPFRWLYEPSGKLFPKPDRFEDMKRYAQILAEGFPFVRVDFYEVDGKPYLGEMTFFHGGGCGWFEPDEVDYQLGAMLNLPPKMHVPWENFD